jgi:hypothetical protein
LSGFSYFNIQDCCSVALLDDGRKLGKKIQHCIRGSQACILDLDCIWKSTCSSNGDLKAIHDSPQGSSPNISCNNHTDTTLTCNITLPQSPFQMTNSFALSHYYNSLQTHHKRKQTQQSTPTTLPQPFSFTKPTSTKKARRTALITQEYMYRSLLLCWTLSTTCGKSCREASVVTLAAGRKGF